MADFRREDEILASDVLSGEYVAWRRDIKGVQWFRRRGPILGVPPDDTAAAEFDDVLLTGEDDDELVDPEFFSAEDDGDDDTDL